MSEMKGMKEKKTKKAYIESLKKGTTRVDAAEACGVCTTTIWNWTQKDEDFRANIESALESRIQVVEDALYSNASNNINNKQNIAAQIFWLKNRNSKKWSDKQELDIVMPKIVKEIYFIQSGVPPVIKEEPESIQEEDQEKH